jgi:hypothetical protein
MRGRDLMKRAVGTGTGVLIVAACALAVGAGAGYAVSKDDDATVVHTCYRVNKDGSPAWKATLRVVSASATCRRNERPLTWNLRGAPGPAGAPGPPGPAGPPGPSSPASSGCDLEQRIAKALPTFQTSDACSPPPLCNDDPFEPNNTLAQAIPLDIGTTTSAVACAADDDLFAVATAGAGLTASAHFDASTALEVTLLDTSGTTLASASGSTSPVTVTTPAGTTGTVYVRVRAVGNAVGAYTLWLS